VKVIILAGGLGTRISAKTADKPKPIVQIGDKPIIWHVMKIFASKGFSGFAIATSYKVGAISN
jgi:glucose-1-phosphate cytidylyltransferase